MYLCSSCYYCDRLDVAVIAERLSVFRWDELKCVEILKAERGAYKKKKKKKYLTFKRPFRKMTQQKQHYSKIMWMSQF